MEFKKDHAYLERGKGERYCPRAKGAAESGNKLELMKKGQAGTFILSKKNVPSLSLRPAPKIELRRDTRKTEGKCRKAISM